MGKAVNEIFYSYNQLTFCASFTFRTHFKNDLKITSTVILFNLLLVKALGISKELIFENIFNISYITDVYE